MRMDVRSSAWSLGGFLALGFFCFGGRWEEEESGVSPALNLAPLLPPFGVLTARSFGPDGAPLGSCGVGLRSPLGGSFGGFATKGFDPDEDGPSGGSLLGGRNLGLRSPFGGFDRDDDDSLSICSPPCLFVGSMSVPAIRGFRCCGRGLRQEPSAGCPSNAPFTGLRFRRLGRRSAESVL